MENIEKVAFPLMVVGAIAAIYALFRRQEITQVIRYGGGPAYVNGSDPATVQGESQANVYTGIQRVNAAIAYPWSYATGRNEPVTINTPAPEPTQPKRGCNGCSKNVSGCGCLSPCDTGVRFVDGHGRCLAPETDIPSGYSQMHQLIDLVYNANNGFGLPESA